MTSYEQRLSLQELLSRRPGANLPELAEALRIPAGPEGDAFEDLQYSKNQLREQVASLQARNRELEAYDDMVANELKESLAVMVLTSNLVTNIPNLTREGLKEYLRHIKSIAYQMGTIINSLLLFSEVSKTEAPLEHVDMADVVANVRERLGYMIEEYQAQIDLPEFWPGVIGYAPWIEEVWANYLSNALKYGGRPPHVELGASAQPDGMVRFWARDNGPGLPAEAQPRLFTPFNQLDRVSNRGHGLGLSIVLSIVENWAAR